MERIYNKLLNLPVDKQLMIIAPNSFKSAFLSFIADKKTIFRPFSIMTIEELCEKVTYQYHLLALPYLMNSMSYNYDTAQMYLDQMRYLPYIDINKLNISDIKKYQLLNELKEKLISLGYLFKGEWLNRNSDRYYFIICGYFNLTNYQKKVLQVIDYQFIPIIETSECQTLSLVINELPDIEQETAYMLESMASLLTTDVDCNDIKIVGVNEKNKETINYFSQLYHLNIASNEESTLDLYPIVKEITIKLIHQEELDLSIYLDFPQIQKIILEVIRIINEQQEVINLYHDNDTFLIDYLFNIYKKTNIINSETKKIEVINLDEALILEDKHLFLINFNQGNFPNLYNDDDYFTDETKINNGLDDSLTLNKIERDKLLLVINSNNYLHISYAKYNHQEPLFPSEIIKELKVEPVKRKMSISRFASEYNCYQLGCGLDKYFKYHEENDNLRTLIKNYDIHYNEYDHTYKEIDLHDYQNKLHNKLNLSYSSLDTYYNCAFKYYIKYVLKIDPFNDNFNTFIGNLFHSILAVAFIDTFDFDKVWEEQINKLNTQGNTYQLSLSEQFILNKFKIEFKDTIQLIKEQDNYLTNYQTLLEKVIIDKFYLKHNNELYDISIKGIVDKILYKVINDEELKQSFTYFMIIDYKTGKLVIDLDKVSNGLSMQLLMYLYLTSKMDHFQNGRLVGLYLQKIANLLPVGDNEDEIKTDKLKKLRLHGFTNNDLLDYAINKNEEALFDKTYENSKLIYGMKTLKSGQFASSALLLTDKEIDELLLLTKQKIDEAIHCIIDGIFTINPKTDQNGINLSCSKCTYHDLCYKVYQDEQSIGEEDGDDDEMD